MEKEKTDDDKIWINTYLYFKIAFGDQMGVGKDTAVNYLVMFLVFNINLIVTDKCRRLNYKCCLVEDIVE
jgi:hypothetical protein